MAGDPPLAGSVRTAVTQGRAWSSVEDEELRDGVELGLALDDLGRPPDPPRALGAPRQAVLALCSAAAQPLP